MRKLSLVIAGILGVGSPLISQAATLGEAQVQSYLSEPLEVRVPLTRSSNEPLDEITVQLAPPAFYREAGVPLANLTGNLTFAIESERGRDYVVIGSKRPIRDPIISMLLQVKSPQGRMIRSYNLLLDPPTMASAAPKAEQPASEPKTEPTGAQSSASSSWQRVDPAQDVELGASREVQRGDTLSAIARDYAGEGQDIRPVMQAIIDANPHAFANGNGNALLAGAELKVPSSSTDVDAETSTDTSDRVDLDSQAENDSQGETAQQLPALELLSPDADEASGRTELGGFGELSRTKPLPAIADGTRTTAQPLDRGNVLEQEQLESVKAENEALTDQLRSLKEQIDSVKVAVDERDATIADLREAVEESRQQAEQTQNGQDNFWIQWGKYLTGAMGLLIIALLIALGLRRAGREEEPAVPMPATADTVQEPRTVQPSERETSPSGVTGAAAAGAATGALAASDHDDDSAVQPTEQPVSKAPGSDDPMNPEMALEEARVLESFNLPHQALELLQESLAEHPGHAGLQSAINRLSGLESDNGEGEPAEVVGTAESPVEETDTAAEDAPLQEEEPPLEEENRSVGGQTEAEEGAPPSEQSGEIAWDEDFDDMLATPETHAAPGSGDNLMEFDDSFALETPADEPATAESEATDAQAPTHDESLELPENEEPAASVETAPRASDEEPEALDLDLSGYQVEADAETPEGGEAPKDEGLDLGTAPEQEEEPADESAPAPGASASAGESDADVDTRVSLAEAFLDVGDRESFEMIEAELREEGATAALERLDELKQRYGS